MCLSLGGGGIQQCPTEGEGGVGTEGEGLTYLDTYLQGVIPREGGTLSLNHNMARAEILHVLHLECRMTKLMSVQCQPRYTDMTD